MATLFNGTALFQLHSELNRLEKTLLDLSPQKKMNSNTEQATSNRQRGQAIPIAIVGMSAIFPNAKNLQQYWDNIVGKVDCLSEVPSSRWSVDDYYAVDPQAPDKTYCKRGGFIPKIDFDPLEFGLPPNILEVTDISQLLSLVAAKEALKDAGYWIERSFNRERTGVILGAVGRQLSVPLSARLQYPIWEKVLRNSGVSEQQVQQIVEKIKSAYVGWQENAFPGMLSNVIAGRIANRLDFGGINCTIDAACASSLAALQMAVSELQEYRCDMMLTGGVDPDNSIFTYICFSKTPALSRQQQSKPFDADSDGMMLGEGLGMVVLKRLKDAQRDGDKIYAVLKGIGTSSDGKYKSIYAPHAAGQVKALRRAYEDAGIDPATVGLIEAHGTGTMTGDPTEFQALKEFFSENNPHTQYIALGSVKSQIGHTKTAAGIASLIKAALALYHQILPPTINITRPNPKLGIETSAFYLNTKTRPWITPDQTPRRAGVSSFGFGGTNFHVVLEEATGNPGQAERLHNNPQAIILFAQTSAGLKSKCQAVLEQLQAENGERDFIELIGAYKHLKMPIDAARVGFVAKSLTEACEKLQTSIKLLQDQAVQTWEHPQGIYYRASGINLQGKVVALFSGQGSQYLEMGQELALNFPDFRKACAHLDALLCQDGLQPLSSVLFPPPTFDPAQQEAQAKQLQRTEYVQPAIGLLSSSLYKILQQAGFEADFAAGHSFGELTALWAAGVLSEKDYFFLVKARGQAMAVPEDSKIDSGTMLAVQGEISQIEATLKSFPELMIANHNSPRQVVLAGSKAAITRVQQVLSEQGFSARLLPVAAAFHTPLVARAQKPFAQEIQQISFHPPKIPVYTNVTGGRYLDDPQAIQKTLKEHLLNQVLFRQEIENIYAAGGYCFVEFGPRNILTNLVKEILGDRPHLAIALNASRQKDSDLQLREAIVQLQVAGLPLQNFDPYAIEPKLVEQKAPQGMSVSLDGSNFVSEKTKKQMSQALQEEPQLQTSAVVAEGNGYHAQETVATESAHSKKFAQALPEKTSAVVAEGNGYHAQLTAATAIALSKELAQALPEAPQLQTSAVVAEGSGSHAQPSAVLAHSWVSNVPATGSVPTQLQPSKPKPAMTLNNQRILESLEYNLDQFSQHQSDTLSVHRQYLSHQSEYAKTFFQLMQQQIAIFGNTPAIDQSDSNWRTLLENSGRSLIKFHEQQAGTLSVHEQYLNHQLDYVKNLLHLTHKSYSLLLAGEAANDNSQGASFISATLQQNTPSLPKSVVEAPKQRAIPESVVEAPKQRAIPNNTATDKISPEIYPESNLTPTTEPETSFKVITWSEQSEKIERPPLPSSMIALEDLSQTMLKIVSEKTGYPVEMLNLEMDLEADLGIDSIKRVEILGALQDSYPSLPQPNLEELAEVELRTLNQIVVYLRQLVPSTEPSASELSPDLSNHHHLNNGFLSPIDSIAPSLDLSELLPDLSNHHHLNNGFLSPIGSITASVDLGDLSQTLLNIVSEKTGYPVEMLNLEMDLEADLGIDSIKRVEILGALQDSYPSLPQPNLEELAEVELRTLNQIVDYLGQLTTEKKNLHPSLMTAYST